MTTKVRAKARVSAHRARVKDEVDHKASVNASPGSLHTNGTRDAGFLWFGFERPGLDLTVFTSIAQAEQWVAEAIEAINKAKQTKPCEYSSCYQCKRPVSPKE